MSSSHLNCIYTISDGETKICTVTNTKTGNESLTYPAEFNKFPDRTAIELSKSNFSKIVSRRTHQEILFIQASLTLMSLCK